MKTFSAKPHEVKREWYVIDAQDKVLGRVADEVARHSGFPGGIYQRTFREMQDKFPGRALEQAVKGMLPKGPLGYAMIRKLKVYAGSEHQHAAQQPKVLEI